MKTPDEEDAGLLAGMLVGRAERRATRDGCGGRCEESVVYRRRWDGRTHVGLNLCGCVGLTLDVQTSAT